MSAKTKKPSAADVLKAQLSSVVTSDKRGGEAVAKKALEKPTERKKDQPKGSQPKTPSVKSELSKKSPKAPATAGKLEKITISLHAADLNRLDEIENALRKAKVPGRGIATSTLIKIAIAGFEADSKRLMELLELVKGQDRRKNKEV